MRNEISLPPSNGIETGEELVAQSFKENSGRRREARKKDSTAFNGR